MVATLNIIIPLISQAIISSVGFVISLGIDGGLSLIYQAITLLGCGGCGLGGGTIGAGVGGLTMTGIVGTIMSWVAIGLGALGLGGGGVIGGGIVGIIEEAVGALASFYNTLCQLFS